MAFLDEIYVTILPKVQLWFLNGNYFRELCNKILALFFLSLGLKVNLVYADY